MLVTPAWHCSQSNLGCQQWACINYRKIIPTGQSICDSNSEHPLTVERIVLPGQKHSMGYVTGFMFHKVSYKKSCLTFIYALLYANLRSAANASVDRAWFSPWKLTEKAPCWHAEWWEWVVVKFTSQSWACLSAVKTVWRFKTSHSSLPFSIGSWGRAFLLKSMFWVHLLTQD